MKSTLATPVQPEVVFPLCDSLKVCRFDASTMRAIQCEKAVAHVVAEMVDVVLGRNRADPSFVRKDVSANEYRPLASACMELPVAHAGRSGPCPTAAKTFLHLGIESFLWCKTAVQRVVERLTVQNTVVVKVTEAFGNMRSRADRTRSLGHVLDPITRPFQGNEGVC